MSMIEQFFFYAFLFFLGAVGIYLAARLISAAVYRSKKEYEKK